MNDAGAGAGASSTGRADLPDPEDWNAALEAEPLATTPTPSGDFVEIEAKQVSLDASSNNNNNSSEQERRDIARGERILRRLRRFAMSAAERGHTDILVNFNRLEWSESNRHRSLVSQPLTSDKTKAEGWLKFLQDLDPINRNSMFLSANHPAGGDKWVLAIRIPDFYMVRMIVFTLVGCGACKALKPQVDRLMNVLLHNAIGAGQIPNDVFASVLVDRGTNTNVDMYQRYGVQRFPTMLVLLEEPSTAKAQGHVSTPAAPAPAPSKASSSRGTETAMARWHYVPGWPRQADKMFQLLQQADRVRQDQ